VLDHDMYEVARSYQPVRDEMTVGVQPFGQGFTAKL
jgi:hypothetical protein